MSGIVSTLSPGAFVVSGAYVFEAPAAPAVPQGPNTSLIGIVGCFTDGQPQTPIFASASGGSAGPLFAQVGAGTTLPNSGIIEALAAMPECTQFVFLRVTDGTETAAKIHLVDTATPTPADVLVLTAINPGTNANGATARVDLVSGSPTSNPLYRVTINYPYRNPEVFDKIVGYSVVGGAYDAAAFQANAVAAINGTAPNSVASTRFTAAAGSSTIAPATGTSAQGSGGTDGTSGVNSASLIGVDGNSGRKGMYALKGTGFSGLILAGLVDLTVASTIAGFCQQQGAISAYAANSGETTDSFVAAKTSNNANSQFMLAVQDWDWYFDSVSGAKKLISPLGAVMGIVMSLDPWVDPCNKPYIGKMGISGTERTSGQPIDGGEAGERQTNGIIYLTNNMPRGGGLLGLPHGQASDGSNILDTRMLNYIARQLLAIYGQFVGETQTESDADDTRAQASGVVNAFFRTLLNPKKPRVSAAKLIMDTTINTPTTIEQGFLIAQHYVKTLSGIKYILAAVQIGNTVQIVANPTTVTLGAAA